ncbi:MAG TPA: TMEM175 family protein [Polyangiaceae bacterium]|nr:TMEM175 family protein [Polyangiaceae bacterium]
MAKGRLEAFSDGVIAIILTIMALEMKVPHGDDLDALTPVLPVLLGYLLSFVYIGIYWNNHHHMLHATRQIDGRVMWANLHLLFWLSLVPVATGWLGEHPHAAWPSAVYGILLFMAATAYTLLQWAIVALNGRESILARAVGADIKGKISLGLYAVAIGAAFVSPLTSQGLYTVVALIWFIPDPRIEKAIGSRGT